MDFFIQAFNALLFQPLFNALILIYQYLPGQDFGVAVIVLTILIRVALYPLMASSLKAQKALSEMQPKIQELQQKYKDDKEKQAKEVMALYQKEKLNPFGGCLPVLLQLPILFALFRVFWQGLTPEAMGSLYSFVPNPGAINPMFIGLVNLAEPSIFIAFLAGITQFFQSKMLLPKNNPKPQGGKASQFTELFQKQMLYFFPIFTVLILWKLPAAIGIYWIVTALFSIFQQNLIFNKKKTEKTS